MHLIASDLSSEFQTETQLLPRNRSYCIFSSSMLTMAIPGMEMFCGLLVYSMFLMYSPYGINVVVQDVGSLRDRVGVGVESCRIVILVRHFLVICSVSDT